MHSDESGARHREALTNGSGEHQGGGRFADPSEHLRVAVLGTGSMGSAIVRLVREKQGMALAGLYSRRQAAMARDDALGTAADDDTGLGVPVSGNLARMLKSTSPHVVIQATCSRVEDAAAEIHCALEHGANVISIAEEMAYPSCQSSEMANVIQALALERQLSVVGTGVNPGFVLDLLVIALSGVCQRVEFIRATRVNDLSPYGPSVLRSQGVGLTPRAFDRGVARGTVLGHVGFPESLAMIAAQLGWTLERIEQRREAIVSTVRRETPFVTVEPGRVAGCNHTAIGYANGVPAITLIHPQQVHPQAEGIDTGDRIEITGIPGVRLEGSPEIPGGIATAAIAVNMIPRIVNAPPGLFSMADLPVPAAIVGDVRALLAAGWQQSACRGVFGPLRAGAP